MTVMADPRYEACHVLAESHDAHAELQHVLLLSGDDGAADAHGRAADLLIRAWRTEQDDPDPVLVEAPCACIECQRFRSAGNRGPVD